MKLPFFTYGALIAAFTLPVLFLAARDRHADIVQPQLEYASSHSSGLDADSNFKFVTERSPYMRNER